ncbi:hypothetical protein V8G54_032462 [Vigna mungo]|uniref:ER membrane protein complex subunit 2 n=1 Tax=Vigna mungo TaxID=3915 RepID=A0AAQ3MMY0_VIGMU
MVTKTEETQLNRLENQVDNGGGGAWDYLCLVRKLKVRRSQKVLKHGLSILNDPKQRSSLGADEWTLYEQVAVAAMDCQCLDVAKESYARIESYLFEIVGTCPLLSCHLCCGGSDYAPETVAFPSLQINMLRNLYVVHYVVLFDCTKVLRKRFPDSKRVGGIKLYHLNSELTLYSSNLRSRFNSCRLEAMLFEAKGSWELAEKAYASLLEDNPLDQVNSRNLMGKPKGGTVGCSVTLCVLCKESQKANAFNLFGFHFVQVIHKRRVAMAKAQGNISVAIDWLNKYLETFMADHDAWRELAEIYVSLQMYKQAAFCYEELILSQPTVPLYHLAYADVLYTLGGLENLQTAKKYYASTIDLTGGKNTRALFGICLCASAITQLTKGKSKEEKEGSQLQSLAAKVLEKDYKQRAPDKLPQLTTALKSLTLSS